MKSQIKYIYPQLSNHDFGFIRFGGPGLANCMFVAARAYIESVKTELEFISPTWEKISIGPIIRHERDKRIYNNIFNKLGIKGFKKFLLINFCKKNVKMISGLGNYFSDLNNDKNLVNSYFNKITPKESIKKIDNANLNDCVAVHVRLGDYNASLRVSIEWYKGIISTIRKYRPDQRFILFSDGTDEEVKPLTSIANVSRQFFGNAYADMLAISKCKLLIASDSTFSAWGAFLGNVPIIFNRRHFPAVYADNSIELVIGDKTEIPDVFLKNAFDC